MMLHAFSFRPATDDWDPQGYAEADEQEIEAELYKDKELRNSGLKAVDAADAIEEEKFEVEAPEGDGAAKKVEEDENENEDEDIDDLEALNRYEKQLRESAEAPIGLIEEE